MPTPCKELGPARSRSRRHGSAPAAVLTGIVFGAYPAGCAALPGPAEAMRAE
ncbi:hypothetical protein OJF2_46530 [Aquisphaera giovannonii]|uniref:Uncharacterized protein n=1 Tax=Aquisphaera giovannonii TaxID=406548 RepID=A0A5B9W654_9BACT|nr:hypothetical protein [Aquisphaera giovannonii]QEH36093.1 hypothetical protein OJF2_46530 [Aquisphaera giovannonii]